jgi:predicted exporter
LRDLSGLEPAMRAAMVKHGFEVESFEPFFVVWRELLVRPTWPTYDDLVLGLRGTLTGPLGLMMEAGPNASWYATLTNHPPGIEPPAAMATVSSAQLESFNRLFGRYRVSALWLSAIGLGLVGLSVLVVYGIRRGIRIFALPAGSCLFAFGLLGLAGQTLNLFHLLGAFLGVCLSHNYAIFSAENAARGDLPPPSIRLSALTTAASFGVLALSHIPVIAALGLMVATIVLTALFVVELEPFSVERVGQKDANGR